MVSFPLASNHIAGLLLRFLGTTVPAAVSLSVCETLLSLPNPSHRAQQELWAPKRSWNRSDRTRAAFYSSWELKQHCVRALAHSEPAAPLAWCRARPSRGCCPPWLRPPGPEAPPGAAAGAAAHGHQHTAPLVPHSNSDHMGKTHFPSPS